MAEHFKPRSRKDRRRTRSEERATTSSIAGILTTLKAMGCSSLGRQLSWIATCSFISGLAQASILVIISEFAINSTQGKTHLLIRGHSISIPDAIALSIILLFIYSGAGIAAGISISSTTSKALASVRAKIVSAFFRTTWRLQAQERLGHLQQLLTFNCEKVGETTLGMASGLQSLLTLIALLLVAFLVNPVAAMIVLVFGIFLSFVLHPFNTWGRKASAHLSENSHFMATLVTEYTRLAREFRLLGVEREATTGLLRSNEIAARTYRQFRLLQQLISVIYQTLGLAFIICAFAFIAGRTEHNLGAIAAVLLLMLRSLSYSSATQVNVQSVRSYGGFLDTIKQELDRFSQSPSELKPGEIPANFDINVTNVSFSYDDRGSVLKRVTFHLPDGQILGIVGRSGSGKTTLSQILLGMLEPESGIVLVGEVPATGIAKGDGLSPVALVAQEPVLLEGSIAFNISFFRDLDPAKIEAASRGAHLHEDVMEMPDLYETGVGEGGTALSGGQRQRLAIARALAGAPRLLVMDEPTSAVDSHSESLIRQTLTELHGKVTSIIISHRLALVEDCDLLLVLEKGRVADFGPRREVLARAAFQEVANTVADDAPRQ
jgi:ABC-type multidrug transport system fused ATPase/permease subunit